MNNISSTNIVTINRGDDFSFKYKINLGDELNPKYYILTDSDRVYLGVTEPGQAFEDAIIRQVYFKTDMVDNDLIISFKSLDTEYLMPGKYYYSIKLCRNKGTESEQITTLINKKLFWILGDAPQVNENVQNKL